MRVEGKLAVVTGAARGQGRSHCVRLAEEGADIIAIDVCRPSQSATHYPVATEAELRETADLVTGLGRKCVARRADVREFGELSEAIGDGVTEIGRGVDVIVANAAIISLAPLEEVGEVAWQETIDVNLTGVWNTVRATFPHLNDSASIVATGSTASVKGFANCGPYVAAKHGLVGLVRTLAAELGPRGIRANAVHPTSTATPMHLNDTVAGVFVPEVEEPSMEEFAARCQSLHLLPVAWVEPRDISNAVLFLASDEARYITGIELPVDAGLTQK